MIYLNVLINTSNISWSNSYPLLLFQKFLFVMVSFIFHTKEQTAAGWHETWMEQTKLMVSKNSKLMPMNPRTRFFFGLKPLALYAGQQHEPSNEALSLDVCISQLSKTENRKQNKHNKRNYIQLKLGFHFSIIYWKSKLARHAQRGKYFSKCSKWLAMSRMITSK